MTAPSVTKNPVYPTQKAPFGKEARCGLTWDKDVTIRFGRYSKFLPAVASTDLGGHGDELPAAIVAIRSYLAGSTYGAILAETVAQFEAFVNQGLIAGANALRIEIMLDRAARYGHEAQSFSAYWGDEMPASENGQLYRLAISAILNLRCSQEAMFSVVLYDRNMLKGTGRRTSLSTGEGTARPQEEAPRISAEVVPDEPPPVIEDPPYEDGELYDAGEDEKTDEVEAPAEPKKNTNKLLLIGAVAAVALLDLKRKS